MKRMIQKATRTEGRSWCILYLDRRCQEEEDWALTGTRTGNGKRHTGRRTDGPNPCHAPQAMPMPIPLRSDLTERPRPWARNTAGLRLGQTGSSELGGGMDGSWRRRRCSPGLRRGEMCARGASREQGFSATRMTRVRLLRRGQGPSDEGRLSAASHAAAGERRALRAKGRTGQGQADDATCGAGWAGWGTLMQDAGGPRRY
jgi:hypothetical protein